MRKYLLFLSLFLFAACGSKPSSDLGVRIAMLKGPSAMGMVQMIDSLRNISAGGDSAAGISVDIFTEPMQVRKAMLEGEADFAALPMNIAVVLFNKRVDYPLVAVPVSGSLYLAGSGSDIRGWNDLRGRKVYVMARGMTPDLLFRHLLERNGLVPDVDVTFDYNFPTHTDIASAMAAGRVPLGVITEPYLSMVSASNPSIRPLLDLNAEWILSEGTPLAETAFIVRGDLLREQPEVVSEVLSAYKRSTEFVNANPVCASALMVKYGIIADTASARRAIQGTHLIFKKGKEHKAEIDAYLRVLYKMSPEIIGGKMPDEEFYQ